MTQWRMKYFFIIIFSSQLSAILNKIVSFSKTHPKSLVYKIYKFEIFVPAGD